MTATRFDQVALALADRGWRPIPIYALTKQPCLPGWDGLCRDQWDRADLGDMVRPGGRFAGEGYACAIAAPPDLLLLDLDILDEDQATAASAMADSMLGETPLVRVGRAPKQARVYRADRPGLRTRRLHPIEMMSGTGSLTCFAVHAETGMPYRWTRGFSPLDIDADDPRIPAVRAEQVERFLVEMFAIVPRTAKGTVDAKPRLFKRRPVMAAVGGGGLHEELRLRARLVGFERAIREFLQQDIEGIRNEVGFASVAACAGRGWSTDAIRDLFEQHWNGWEGFSRRQLESAIDRLVDPAPCWDQPVAPPPSICVAREPRRGAIFNRAPWRR